VISALILSGALDNIDITAGGGIEDVAAK